MVLLKIFNLVMYLAFVKLHPPKKILLLDHSGDQLPLIKRGVSEKPYE